MFQRVAVLLDGLPNLHGRHHAVDLLRLELFVDEVNVFLEARVVRLPPLVELVGGLQALPFGLAIKDGRSSRKLALP